MCATKTGSQDSTLLPEEHPQHYDTVIQPLACFPALMHLVLLTLKYLFACNYFVLILWIFIACPKLLGR